MANKFILVVFDDAIENSFELETFFKILTLQVKLVVKLQPTKEIIDLTYKEYKQYLGGKPIISIHFSQNVPILPLPDGAFFSSEDYQKALDFAREYPGVKVWVEWATYMQPNNETPDNFRIISKQTLNSYFKEHLKKKVTPKKV